MNGLKILIVDDDAALNTTVRKFLGVYNDLSVAENLAEARRILENRTIDVILLDCALPDGNGLDLLRSIRGKLPFVPVIVMTADPDFNAVQKAISAGADDYLMKSEDIVPDLMVRIPVAINSAKARRVAVSAGESPDLSLPQTKVELTPEHFEQFLFEAERAYISAALNLCDGNATESAEYLGVARSTLFKKISDLKIAKQSSGVAR